MLLNKIKRVVLGIVGTQLLFIAIFLIIFPILPVRPLLKLIKICYFNSSEKLYDWFTNHRVFGNILYKKNILTKKNFLIRTGILLILLYIAMYVSGNTYIRLVSTVLILCGILYNYYKTLK